MEQIELLINVLDVIDTDDLYEDNTPESVLDSTHDELVKVQKYLLRKLG